MTRRFVRVGLALALGLGLATLQNRTSAAGVADDKDARSPSTSVKEPAAKAPDFSRYAFVDTATGEIVRVHDKKLVLRVTWFVQQNAGNTRPQLNRGGGNMRRPNNVRPPMMKEMHHDYELEYVPESLVRTKILPPKLDENGKRAMHTTSELQALKTPPGVVGYVASPSDLVPGTIVDVILIREKSVPADKITENDLRVKYAVILGTNQTPPKDVGTTPKKN